MAIVICCVFLFSILTMISDVFIIYIASLLTVRKLTKMKEDCDGKKYWTHGQNSKQSVES